MNIERVAYELLKIDIEEYTCNRVHIKLHIHLYIHMKEVHVKLIQLILSLLLYIFELTE